MKIIMCPPDGPYSSSVDPGVMDVTLIDVFKGVTFNTSKSPVQEILHVSMRDNGYEVRYLVHNTGAGEDDAKTVNSGWFEFKDGKVTGPAMYPRAADLKRITDVLASFVAAADRADELGRTDDYDIEGILSLDCGDLRKARALYEELKLSE